LFIITVIKSLRLNLKIELSFVKISFAFKIGILSSLRDFINIPHINKFLGILSDIILSLSTLISIFSEKELEFGIERTLNVLINSVSI